MTTKQLNPGKHPDAGPDWVWMGNTPTDQPNGSRYAGLRTKRIGEAFDIFGERIEGFDSVFLHKDDQQTHERRVQEEWRRYRD